MNNTICSLDLKIHRENDGSLKIAWYQRPTSSGRLINFQSNYLPVQKIGVVFRLLHRAIGLSHGYFHEANISRVKSILSKNGYPTKFIMRCVRDFQARHRTQEGDSQQADEPTLKNCDKFPLVYGLSHQLNRCFANTNSKLVFYNLRRLGDLYSKLKDQIPVLNRYQLIYKITCECSLHRANQAELRRSSEPT